MEAGGDYLFDKGKPLTGQHMRGSEAQFLAELERRERNRRGVPSDAEIAREINRDRTPPHYVVNPGPTYKGEPFEYVKFDPPWRFTEEPTVLNAGRSTHDPLRGEKRKWKTATEESINADRERRDAEHGPYSFYEFLNERARVYEAEFINDKPKPPPREVEYEDVTHKRLPAPKRKKPCPPS